MNIITPNISLFNTLMHFKLLFHAMIEYTPTFEFIRNLHYLIQYFNFISSLVT